MRTRILDSETYRIKADIHFDGTALAEQVSQQLEAEYDRIKNVDDFKAFAGRYADQVVDLLAAEIDKIERRIREEVPEAKHLDLEADL